MDHPQPITKVCTYNTTAAGIDNNKIKQHQSRAINIRYLWTRNQKTLTHFIIAWKSGQEKNCQLFYEASFCKAS